MAAKKSSSKKTIAPKTTMIKIAEKVGELAGRIANEKDHLVEVAGEKIRSVKNMLGRDSPQDKTPGNLESKKNTRKPVKKKTTNSKKEKVSAAGRKALGKAAVKKQVKKKAVKKANAKS